MLTAIIMAAFAGTLLMGLSEGNYREISWKEFVNNHLGKDVDKLVVVNNKWVRVSAFFKFYEYDLNWPLLGYFCCFYINCITTVYIFCRSSVRACLAARPCTSTSAALTPSRGTWRTRKSSFSWMLLSEFNDFLHLTN